MYRLLLVVSHILLASGLLATMGCPTSPPSSQAFKIERRAQLIGGPRALGEVGDWMLENGKVRFIIQDTGFSRGFGVFGGALLDADLVRETSSRGNSEGGTGKDNFGEMFPAFFLEALDPREVFDPNNPGAKLAPIEIENDGSDGKAAVLVIRGNGGDFLALSQNINQVLLGDDRVDPSLLFETRYILEPDATYIKMTTRVQNVANPPRRVKLPNASLGDAVVPTPFGDVMLFGAGNKVFAPHPAGFDIRFTLEDIYAEGDIALPALPGITAEFIASAGKDVSYGLLVEPPTAPTENFVQANADQFQNTTDHSLHIPFLASAFTGVFQVLPPPILEPNDEVVGGTDEMSFSRYFIVGDGDVSSISDTVYALLKDRTGTLQGRVRFDGSAQGIKGASIMVVADDGAKVTQIKTDDGGRFQAKLRPGNYSLVVTDEGLASKGFDGVVIAADTTTRQELTMPPAATLVVTITEEGGGRIPAKVSLVGITPPEHVGEAPRRWLYDLSIGEDFRYTDFVDDVAGDISTLRYIEHFDYAIDGTLTMTARPGTYTVVVGRGIEYDRVEIPVALEAGKSVAINAVLKHVVDTSGYVGGDFHLHSVFSLDSNAKLTDRIASYAGEGVEYAVSTDHNFVVDYRATIEKLGMQRFINSAIGLELTTIDRGHFNGFPLDRGPGTVDEDTIASRTYGSFEWALRDPGDIFADLRSRGRKVAGSDTPSPIVLQVNHPRDSILGYFDQYGVDAETLEVKGQSGLIAPDPIQHPEFSKDAFSFDFDAVEVFNGKRFEFLQTFKVPAGVSRDPASCCPLRPGELMREYPGPECADDVDPAQCNCLPENCVGANAAVCQARQDAQVDANKCNPDRFDVAFPGVVDDWLHLLLTGKRVVGTANSDSHEPDKEEPGSPRSYFRAPTDNPAQVSPDDVVAAFKSGDVLMTNGPFVRVDIGGTGMGGTVAGASHTLKVHIEQAPWIKADTVRVLVGTRAGIREELRADLPATGELELPIVVEGDAFVVVEVSSIRASASLFPSVYPNEIPPLQFTDVIGSLGSSFGLDSLEGALQPKVTFVTTPYALTNPIFIDGDGDGVVNPGATIPGREGVASTAPLQDKPRLGLTRPVVTVPTEEEALHQAALEAWNAIPVRKRIALSRLPRWLWPSNDPRDVRRSLVQFTRHAD